MGSRKQGLWCLYIHQTSHSSNKRVHRAACALRATLPSPGFWDANLPWFSSCLPTSPSSESFARSSSSSPTWKLVPQGLFLDLLWFPPCVLYLDSLIQALVPCHLEADGHMFDLQPDVLSSKLQANWEVGISRCKLVYIGWINNKVLLYSTGNYIQYLVQMEQDLWSSLLPPYPLPAFCLWNKCIQRSEKMHKQRKALK